MDGGSLLILGKLVLTFAVLLGLPLWELHALRRDRPAGRGGGRAGRADGKRGG